MENQKTVNFNKDDIEKLPNNKPAVYEILNKNNENIYTGIAERSRVIDRIKEHLPSGKDSIPGGRRVKIIQKTSINEAKESEERIILRSQPKYNKKK